MRHGDSTGMVAQRRARVLWRGPVLDELRATTAFEAERVRLAELFDAVDLAWLSQRARDEPAPTIVPDLQAALAADPGRTAVAVLLAEVLWRTGRHADALRAIDSHRRAVVDRSGLDPPTEVAELEQRILATGRHVPTPESAVARARLRRAPVLVGRTEELRTLDAMAGSAPLVTVVGPEEWARPA